jgi:hypothetical protein
MARIGSTPGPVCGRAEALLAVLRGVLPYEVASIAVRDPERRARIALAAAGPAEALHAYCESPQGDAELDLLGLNRPAPPMLHTELPMPAAETLCWPEYLWPAGFGGAVGVGLFTPDGRHVGHLTVLTESAARPTAAERDLIAALVPLMAHAVDRMRSISAAASIVRDATAGVVLTRGGDALPLPGWPEHPLLATGSPTLEVAAERLAAGDTYAVFLAPSETSPEGAETPGALVRVSVLDCAGEAVDHLRGVVLISPPGDLRGLGHRELQILGLLVEGWSDRRIATALDSTEEDITSRVLHATTLLVTPTRTAATIRALREGLFLPPRLSVVAD